MRNKNIPLKWNYLKGKMQAIETFFEGPLVVNFGTYSRLMLQSRHYKNVQRTNRNHA